MVLLIADIHSMPRKGCAFQEYIVLECSVVLRQAAHNVKQFYHSIETETAGLSRASLSSSEEVG